MASLVVQVVSDIHLEFYKDEWGVLKHIDIHPDASVIVLAGDIAAIHDRRAWRRLENLIDALVPHFEHTLLLAGNHEFYNAPRAKEGEWLTHDVVIRELKGLESSRRPGFKFLHRDSVCIDDIVIIGATLWSYVPEVAVEYVESSIRDYRSIAIKGDRGRKRHARVSDTNTWHASDLEFIQSSVRDATLSGKRCLVLTHHCPSMQGTSKPEHTGSVLQHAFSTDLDYMCSRDHPESDYSSIHTWVSGHSHHSYDFRLNGTRLVANQHGYMHELEDSSRDLPYNRQFVIEID